MAPAPTADPAVVDHPEAQRYEIVIDGQAAGFAEYRLVRSEERRVGKEC